MLKFGNRRLTTTKKVNGQSPKTPQRMNGNVSAGYSASLMKKMYNLSLTQILLLSKQSSAKYSNRSSQKSASSSSFFHSSESDASDGSGVDQLVDGMNNKVTLQNQKGMKKRQSLAGKKSKTPSPHQTTVKTTATPNRNLKDKVTLAAMHQRFQNPNSAKKISPKKRSPQKNTKAQSMKVQAKSAPVGYSSSSSSESDSDSDSDSDSSSSSDDDDSREGKKADDSADDYSDDEDEGQDGYKPGGYHRVKIGEVYKQR